MIVAGCGLAAINAKAADPVPMKLPDPVTITNTAKHAAMAGPVTAAPVETVGGCTTCATPTAGCADGKCLAGMHARKADRQQILSGARNCARVPAPIVPSIGTWAREAFATQTQNALAEYFVLHDEEWTYGTAELSPGGRRHMDGIVRRLGGNSHSIKIEPSGTPSLDELRKQAVAQALIHGGCDGGAASNRVVIGTGRAEGLRYEEVEGVYYRSVYGRPGGGGGGAAGFGGGGVSMFGGGIGGGFGR
jgi:hypothetical protein